MSLTKLSKLFSRHIPSMLVEILLGIWASTLLPNVFTERDETFAGACLHPQSGVK